MEAKTEIFFPGGTCPNAVSEQHTSGAILKSRLWCIFLLYDLYKKTIVYLYIKYLSNFSDIKKKIQIFGHFKINFFSENKLDAY